MVLCNYCLRLLSQFHTSAVKVATCSSNSAFVAAAWEAIWFFSSSNWLNMEFNSILWLRREWMTYCLLAAFQHLLHVISKNRLLAAILSLWLEQSNPLILEIFMNIHSIQSRMNYKESREHTWVEDNSAWVFSRLFLRTLTDPSSMEEPLCWGALRTISWRARIYDS